MIVVFGATGHAGAKVAAALKGKKPFRGIASTRSAKLPDIVTGNLADRKFLEQVLADASALFSIIPEGLYPTWSEYASLLCDVLERTPVTHIVNISNAVTERDGKPTLLNTFEDRLNTLHHISIKHLRCGNFFDNLNWGLDNGYRGDLKLPYISTHEVAFTAAGYLLNRNFSGHSADELLGPADYSMDEIAILAGTTRQMVMPEEHRSFFEPFNRGAFVIPARTPNNTTRYANEEFCLRHFLANEYKRAGAEKQ